jgi:hypothetical protein
MFFRNNRHYQPTGGVHIIGGSELSHIRHMSMSIEIRIVILTNTKEGIFRPGRIWRQNYLPNFILYPSIQNAQRIYSYDDSKLFSKTCRR